MSWFSRLLNFKKKFERPLRVLNEINILEWAILSNFDYLASLSAGVDIFPVLKSNAYGHGIEQIATILKKRKTTYLVVDSYYEALRIHAVNPAKILLIGYTLHENFEAMDFSWVTPVISDVETLHALGRLGKKISFHLKLDTGMRRQWLPVDDLSSFLCAVKVYPDLKFEWVCSHFSDADNSEDDSSSLSQVRLFADAIEYIQNTGISLKYKHIANSAGHLKGFWKEITNASRIGLSLYGVNPLEKNDPQYRKGESLRLALEFQSTLVQKKTLKTWETVSYNGTFEAPWDMEIGVVPVGYYEGIDRKLSGGKFLFSCDDKKLPILGRVCMNLTVVDITNKHIEVGDRVTILSPENGDENTVYSIAKITETIPYEVFVKFAESIRRKIVD